jgi:hypothetical protein
MGRSVSYPSNAIVCFGHIEVDEFHCRNCGDTFNTYKDGVAKEGDPEWDADLSADEQADVKRCPHCGEHEDGTSSQVEYAYQDEFDCILEGFKNDVLAGFPSAYEEDHWVGREDHAVAANRFAYFGISEYCGTVALWMSPKDNDYGLTDGLRDHWLEQAEAKFRKLAEDALPNPMRRLGVMSNGEAVYQRVNPVAQGATQ